MGKQDRGGLALKPLSCRNQLFCAYNNQFTWHLSKVSLHHGHAFSFFVKGAPFAHMHRVQAGTCALLILPPGRGGCPWGSWKLFLKNNHHVSPTVLALDLSPQLQGISPTDALRHDRIAMFPDKQKEACALETNKSSNINEYTCGYETRYAYTNTMIYIYN